MLLFITICYWICIRSVFDPYSIEKLRDSSTAIIKANTPIPKQSIPFLMFKKTRVKEETNKTKTRRPRMSPCVFVPFN